MVQDKKPEGRFLADYFGDEPPSTNILRVFAGSINRLASARHLIRSEDGADSKKKNQN